jgi:hypothetical protein
MGEEVDGGGDAPVLEMADLVDDFHGIYECF